MQRRNDSLVAVDAQSCSPSLDEIRRNRIRLRRLQFHEVVQFRPLGLRGCDIPSMLTLWMSEVTLSIP